MVTTRPHEGYGGPSHADRAALRMLLDGLEKLRAEKDGDP